MENETAYGLISDIQKNPKRITLAIKKLASLGAEKLLVNGDIGTEYVATAYILEAIGKSGIESYILPGNYERIDQYFPLIAHFSKKYPNIIDTLSLDEFCIKLQGHYLAFLPGAESWYSSGFWMGDIDKIPTGYKILTPNNLVDLDLIVYHMHFAGTPGHRIIYYVNITDLKKHIKEPDKTIVISHVPRRFDNVETGVDAAIIGECTDDFYFNGEYYSKSQQVFGYEFIETLINEDLPLTKRKENRGHLGLRQVFEEIGVKKAISSHFHESIHRAHDRNCNPIEEGVYHDELFYNSGCLDLGKIGIIKVSNGKVMYQNVKLDERYGMYL